MMNVFLESVVSQGGWALAQIAIGLVVGVSLIGIVTGVLQAIWIMVTRLFGKDMSSSSPSVEAQ